MKEYYILGLHIGLHDSAAALIKNNKIVAMAEQERFSRHKLAEREAPIDAIRFCLQQANISIKDVEYVALGTDWKYRDSLLDIPNNEIDNWIKVDDVERFLPKSIFGKELPSIFYIRHHLAHASSAYRTSGFKDTAILVIDNRGENESSSLGYTKNGEIKFFKQLDISQSLGIFYSRACKYTGLYGIHREVGKFMGLASYGKANMKMPIMASRKGKLFNKLIDISSENNYNIPNIRTKQLENYFLEHCFPYQQGNKEEIMSYANFAASAQASLENVIMDFVKELKEKTGMQNLVIAGGVALNCSSNGKIERTNIFENIYIPPFAGDAGTALGAALELNYKIHGVCGLQFTLETASLGARYSKNIIRETIMQNLNKIYYQEVNYEMLYDIVSEKIAEGKIVAWFQDAFEVGPRALGNRSILADPRDRRSLIKLNNIKEREMWRPIAPSVIKKYYLQYFEGNPNNKYFMNVATIVKKKMRKLIPAVVHVDNTARPQVVDNTNEKFYCLLEAFNKRTGIPMLCNTSFNLKGEPLVNTPQNAIDTFLAKGFDLLVIDNFIVEKKF